MTMEQIKKDVVVVGGGPGGFAAAVTAARAGAQVLLVERNGYLGGQLGSGLPFLAFWDIKGRQVVGGIAQEFVDRLEQAGASYGHEYCPHHQSVTLIHPFYSRILCFEMVKEAGVELLMHCELADVKMKDGKIRSIIVSGKGQHIEITADVFIDGTGDGDLGALSGATIEKGNENNVMQPPTLMFNLGGVNFEEFCDFIEQHPEELPYDVLDNIAQGYNADFFRKTKSFIFLGMHHLLEELRKKGECPVDRETVIFIRQPMPGQVAVNTIRLLNFDGSNLHDLSNGEMEAHLQIPKLMKMFRENVPGFENCYLDSISKWGAVGVKIDFFDRDDAQIIPQYENLAKACAERHLMVDFHGCSKPTGLHRAYPNILSYEAMRCAECFKWDTTSNPDYQLQCIFARMLGGGIDYTPGSMRNSTLEKFKPIDPGLPSSLGTRSHELALFVVLSAPFASLCDSPDEYRKYPDILKYLAEVPTSWDQTIPLAARVGEYAVLAKQKGNTWYIGGLNAWGERTIQVDCSFLPQDKKYTIEIFQDKKRSNKNANLYEHKIMDIDNKNIIEMFMASGGGFVIVIREKK